MLSREDIKKEITGLTNEEHYVDDSLFLYHDVCTNGIGMQIFFLRSMTLM